jgi:hypothetical protein
MTSRCKLNYDQCAVAESAHGRDVLGVEAILEYPQIGSSPPNGRAPLSSSSTRRPAITRHPRIERINRCGNIVAHCVEFAKDAPRVRRILSGGLARSEIDKASKPLLSGAELRVPSSPPAGSLRTIGPGQLCQVVRIWWCRPLRRRAIGNSLCDRRPARVYSTGRASIARADRAVSDLDPSFADCPQ